MNLVLIGYRGSGKSTVGRALAERLRMKFVDSDEVIVQRAGMDIAGIFANQGEAGFRNMETRVLHELLEGDGQIIALGGGAVVREQNRLAIKSHPQNKVFYLHCDAATLHARIVADKNTAAHRPSLTPFAGAIAEVEHLLQQRLPWYRELMNFEIDVNRLTAEEAAERIIELCHSDHQADNKT